MTEARSISMPPNFSGTEIPSRPSFADLRSTSSAAPGFFSRIAGRFGSTSLAQNSSTMRRTARCSSLRSSRVKISSGVMSSRRNAVPFLAAYDVVVVAISAPSVRALKQARRALSAAHAHGHHAIAGFAPLHLIGHGAHHARSGHAEGMSNGNGAAVDVELLRIDAELVAAIDHLHGESLVELPDIDVG